VKERETERNRLKFAFRPTKNDHETLLPAPVTTTTTKPQGREKPVVTMAAVCRIVCTNWNGSSSSRSSFSNYFIAWVRPGQFLWIYRIPIFIFLSLSFSLTYTHTHTLLVFYFFPNVHWRFMHALQFLDGTITFGWIFRPRHCRTTKSRIGIMGDDINFI
jgi:hypothetical protein